MNSQSRSPKAILLFAVLPGANDRRKDSVKIMLKDKSFFCHCASAFYFKQLLFQGISDQFAPKSMAAAMDQAQGAAGIVQVLLLPD